MLVWRQRDFENFFKFRRTLVFMYIKGWWHLSEALQHFSNESGTFISSLSQEVLFKGGKKNRGESMIFYHTWGGVFEGRKSHTAFLEKYFFQWACRIILGRPKHVLHLVWSACIISTAIRTALKAARRSWILGKRRSEGNLLVFEMVPNVTFVPTIKDAIFNKIKPSQMEVAPLHRTFVISHKRRLFKNTKGI